MVHFSVWFAKYLRGTERKRNSCNTRFNKTGSNRWTHKGKRRNARRKKKKEIKLVSFFQQHHHVFRTFPHDLIESDVAHLFFFVVLRRSRIHFAECVKHARVLAKGLKRQEIARLREKSSRGVIRCFLLSFLSFASCSSCRRMYISRYGTFRRC